MKTIPFASFEGMHAPLRQEMLDAFARMYDKGWFIQGQECQAFEEEFAAYCGTRYAVGVASGLDALIEEKTGITTMIAEDPLTAVAIGTGRFIEFAHDMNASLESSMGPSGGREDY